MIHAYHPHVHVPDMSRLMKFVRTWTLPLAIVAGIAAYFIYVNIPWLNHTHSTVAKAVGLIQPALIFAMLFLTFLTITPSQLHLRRWHIWHIVIQIGLFALLAGGLALSGDGHHRILVESAMLCLLCPTATAAAVVTRKLDGSAADITSYTILINIAIAITAPALLPLSHPHEGMTFIKAFGMIIGKVFPILICPLLAAWAVNALLPRMSHALQKLRDLPFYLWAIALSLAIAVTAKAIVHSTVPAGYQLGIAGVSLVCCLLQFCIGKHIGRAYGQETEGGQALGQKNTVFIIWLGYTFLSPVTAGAGGMYSIWHNIFNSYQLYRKQKLDDKN